MALLTPHTLDPIHSRSTAMSGVGDDATDVRISSAVLPPMSLADTYHANGLLAVLRADFASSTDVTFNVDLLDLRTGSVVATGKLAKNFTGATVPSSSEVIQGAGLSMLQGGRAGFAAWYQKADTPVSDVAVLLSQYIDETDGGRRLVEGTGTFEIASIITDVSPFSKTSTIYLLISMAETSSGSAQLMCLKATIDDSDWPESPSTKTLVTLSEFWSQEYTASFWLNRPDTCLVAQASPAIAGGLTPQIVAVMGNWVAPGTHKAVSDPRLVLADIEGNPAWSHEFGYGNAHGMIVNQLGDIFVVGTQDIVNGGDYLICRYGINGFGETQARVAHGADGLGDYTGDPSSTHVINPMWNGSHLVVMDEGPASTYAYVYDRDLVFIKRMLVSSTSTPGGPRFRGSNKATSWWGELY